MHAVPQILTSQYQLITSKYFTAVRKQVHKSVLVLFSTAAPR